MKYIFFTISFFLIFSLNAQEINKKDFPYILPISVEKFDYSADNQAIVKVEEEKVEVEEEKVEEEKVEKKVEVVKIDSDNDGILDTADNCPNTSSDFLVDKHGCPLTATLKINFQSNEAIILKDSYEELDKFTEFLQENTSYDVIISGYTDNSGDKEKNLQLSKDRAKAVMEALIKRGIKLTRLTAIGMGSKNPIVDNDTPEGRAKNRRIEVEIIL